MQMVCHWNGIKHQSKEKRLLNTSLAMIRALVGSVRLLLILFCCLGFVSCAKKIYKPDDFLITKPSWVVVNDKEYKFTGIGIADNIGNIGDILKSAQHNAINGVYYSIFKKVFDIVDNYLIDDNDDNVKIYKQQFITVMNNFDKDFDLEKDTFILNNWLNPDNDKMYVKVVVNEEVVVNRIVYLIDKEIKVAKETTKPHGYLTFLQNIKARLIVNDTANI